MDADDKSIRDQIDCLARLTGAPDTFVDQVRALFLRKGISLDSDSSPYVKALEEAFLREETIRAQARRARRNAREMHSGVRRLSEVYSRQVERLREVRTRLRQDDQGDPSWPPAERRLTVMTPQQTDDLPLVPGPEEPQ